MVPRVSVVVPNYNQGRFLRERFRSILDQTEQDYEVIYVDDASTDQSREVVRELSGDPRIRAVYRTTNSGTAFSPWNEGVGLARAAYVWIAEADDSADPRFLEKLVPVLDRNPSVGLVHCQFLRVDERGEQTDLSDLWWGELDPVRWTRDFVGPGREELRFLGCWNVISNASGVLLRRDVYRRVGGADESMRLAGDWLLWMKMLLVSDVGFVAMPLNRWRWHPATARERSARDGREWSEVSRVLAFYAEQTGSSQRAVESAYHLRKGGHAIDARQPALALRHALASLRGTPLGRAHWRLVLRALAAWYGAHG